MTPDSGALLERIGSGCLWIRRCRRAEHCHSARGENEKLRLISLAVTEWAAAWSTGRGRVSGLVWVSFICFDFESQVAESG